MSDMIERVERAIASKIVILGRPIHHSWAEQAAIAAIKAMREPTEAMAIAGGYEVYDANDEFCPEGAADAWRAMVDAALEDTKTGGQDDV
jgi:hypothetical protein